MKNKKSVVNFKTQSANTKELSSGVVNLAAREGSVFKKALLCRTGVWDGMYGQVVVTEVLLRRIAEKYNKEYAKPLNDHDYAPILKEHIRDADLIKGRVMADMSVEEIEDPATGERGFGLFASLRVDDEDAQTKVEKGQYAQLSISFDDETADFYECSFVAVPAAKRSTVLSNKKKEKSPMGKKNLKASGKVKALTAAIGKARLARKAALAAIKTEQTALNTELVALSEKSAALSLTLKAGQTKAQFSAFVKQGKMNPAELAEMDFKALSQLPDAALAVLKASYEKREVSTDVVQFGQSGQNDSKDALKAASPEKIREAIKLQKSGKKGVNLNDGGAEKSEAEKEAEKAAAAAGAQSYSMGEEEYKQCLADISEINEKLGAVIGKIKAIGEKASDLAAEDEKHEEEEKQLAADAEKESDEEEEQ